MRRDPRSPPHVMTVCPWTRCGGEDWKQQSPFLILQIWSFTFFRVSISMDISALQIERPSSLSLRAKLCPNLCERRNLLSQLFDPAELFPETWEPVHCQCDDCRPWHFRDWGKAGSLVHQSNSQDPHQWFGTQVPQVLMP